MMALLDTDVCVDLIRQREPPDALFARLRGIMDEISAVGAAVSAITMAELREGMNLMPGGRRFEDSLVRLAGVIAPLPFDAEAAEAYGALVADPVYRRSRIGPLDELIAAHAIALGAVLITGNIREFGRAPGLLAVPWRRRPSPGGRS